MLIALPEGHRGVKEDLWRERAITVVPTCLREELNGEGASTR